MSKFYKFSKGDKVQVMERDFSMVGVFREYIEISDKSTGEKKLTEYCLIEERDNPTRSRVTSEKYVFPLIDEC